jgi:hypothetical protein
MWSVLESGAEASLAGLGGAQTRVFSGKIDLKLKSRLIPKAAAVAMATAAFSSARSDEVRSQRPTRHRQSPFH